MYALFLQQTAYKLLDLSLRLRDLGHPDYIEHMVNKSLSCAIIREEANQRVCASVVCMCVLTHHMNDSIARYY